MGSGAEAAEAAGAAEVADPRPKYEGNWEQATGRQRGEHANRVRLWKIRQAEKAGSGMDTQFGQPVSPQHPRNPAAPATSAPPAGPDLSRAVLEGIRDDRKALASDRIRATQALLQLERGEEGQAQDSDLVQLRAVLETLPPHERLAWLQGERAERLSG